MQSMSRKYNLGMSLTPYRSPHSPPDGFVNISDFLFLLENLCSKAGGETPKTKEKSAENEQKIQFMHVLKPFLEPPFPTQGFC